MDGTVNQYIGRTVDHIAFDGMELAREVELEQTLVREDEQGALVTGSQKLAQRFLVELLTEVGTLPYLPSRGTTLMLDARLGGWRTTADVEASFYSALFVAKRNLIEEELETDPDDERFLTATLISVTLQGDSVSLRLKLESRAGTSREIIFPLRINSIG